ncbi:type III-A CRISPR-associated RAMP protein Csm4 [Desulfurobacterium sp.]
MKAIKIRIKPLTPFYTPFQSDTIFGEFCWHYRFLFGKEKLENLLKDFDESPFIVFSSGFPEGHLPFPVVPFNKLPIEGKDVEKYKILKRFKKQHFIKKELLTELITSDKELTAELLFNNLISKLKEKENGPLWKTRRQMHVTIDRRYGSHLESHLFEKNYLFLNPELTLEIYALYNPERISEKEIEETFSFIGLNGLGGEKSTGKGKFEVKSIDKSDLPEAKNPNAFISLSAGMVKETEVEDYYAKFFTKFPKHGPEACLDNVNIFKNPIILVREGSLFKYKKRKETYGRIFKVSKNSNYIHCAKILPLFVRVQ